MMSTKNQDMHKTSMSRRDMVIGVASALAAVGMAGSASADSHGGHHGHAAHDAHAGHGYMPPNDLVKALIDGTAQCQSDGTACIEHCTQLLKAGDVSMAECLDRAQEMVVMCTAMGRMAGFQSAHLKKIVTVCIDVCTDCQKACDKHADKHAECKACSESCAKCIKAAKAYLAAA